MPNESIILIRSTGGTVDSQRDFLESLSNNELRRNLDRQNKIPPVANQFALGYTYYDLLDADHEGACFRIGKGYHRC